MHETVLLQSVICHEKVFLKKIKLKGGCSKMLTDHLIINLLIILAVAWPMGALFARMGLAVMLGQLVTG